MKKVFAAVLAFILAVCGSVACGQTRESIIMLEGMEEKITETLYESENGFFLWYPADMFSLTMEYGHERIAPADETIEDVYLLIVPVEIPVEESEGLIYEATGGYMEGEAEIGEIEAYVLENGIEVKTVGVLCEGVVTRFYLITGSDRVYCLTASYPQEAAEGFGARISAIVETFEIKVSE